MKRFTDIIRLWRTGKTRFTRALALAGALGIVGVVVATNRISAQGLPLQMPSTPTTSLATAAPSTPTLRSTTEASDSGSTVPIQIGPVSALPADAPFTAPTEEFLLKPNMPTISELPPLGQATTGPLGIDLTGIHPLDKQFLEEAARLSKYFPDFDINQLPRVKRTLDLDWTFVELPPTPTPPPPPTPVPTPTPTPFLIDINSADEDLWMRLGGMDERRARAILDFKEKNGPFKSVDDLEQVFGVTGVMIDRWRSSLYSGAFPPRHSWSRYTAPHNRYYIGPYTSYRDLYAPKQRQSAVPLPTPTPSLQSNR